jgi:hypothetical protein
VDDLLVHLPHPKKKFKKKKKKEVNSELFPEFFFLANFHIVAKTKIEKIWNFSFFLV